MTSLKPTVDHVLALDSSDVYQIVSEYQILHTNQTKCSACDIRRFCDECLISGKTKTIYETHTISEDMDTTKILLPIAGVLVAGGLNPAIATIKAMNIWDISVTMSKACGIVVPL